MKFEIFEKLLNSPGRIYTQTIHFTSFVISWKAQVKAVPFVATSALTPWSSSTYAYSGCMLTYQVLYCQFLVFLIPPGEPIFLHGVDFSTQKPKA